MAAGGRVTVEEGVIFGSGGGRTLRCDVYRPPDDVPVLGAVLLVHGGGWFSGDRSQLRGYGILLGREGFVCVAGEYRLTGEATWPAQIHDVKAALRWTRSQAARLGFDPGRLVVWGNSAGGHLALIAAGSANEPDLEGDGGNPGVNTSVAAVVSFYGPAHSWDPANPPRMVDELVGPSPTAATMRAVNPLTYVGPGYPPALLIHGAADDVVPIRDGEALYAAIKAAGAPVEFHAFAGLPHAFDTEPPYGRLSATIATLFLKRCLARG